MSPYIAFVCIACIYQLLSAYYNQVHGQCWYDFNYSGVKVEENYSLWQWVHKWHRLMGLAAVRIKIWIGSVHLRFLKLGREFEDSVKELFVPAKEWWFLRLAGYVEHTKHSDDESRDCSQNGHRHVPRPLLFVRLRLRSVVVVTLVPVDTERHGKDLMSMEHGLGARNRNYRKTRSSVSPEKRYSRRVGEQSSSLWAARSPGPDFSVDDDDDDDEKYLKKSKVR